MAIIKNQKLSIVDVSATLAKVTVTYTVVQFPLEYWANTIYEEDIRLIGDDYPFNPAPPSGTDITVAVFAPVSARNPKAGTIPPQFSFERTRVLYVAKNVLNEDPGFIHGMKVQDEVFALISLRYVANVPFPFTVGAKVTAQTNTVTGKW